MGRLQNKKDYNNFKSNPGNKFQMIKLSFVIPVFNTAAYLEKCINSCLSQNISREEFEIIVIDDGSTDCSLDILKKFSATEENVFVFTQPNQKQGAARNNGLRRARGEYIWFVDSDDWIEKNVLKELLNFAEAIKPDVIRFDATDFYPELNKSQDRPCGHQPNKIYENKEAFLENTFLVCTPFHIFKRTFLLEKKLLFPEGIFYEDSYFMVNVFYELDVFQYWPQNIYFVNKRIDSSTRTSNFESKLDILKVIGKHIHFLNNNNLDPSVRKVFTKNISTNFNSVLLSVAPSPSIFAQAVKILRGIDGLEGIIKESGSLLHYLEFRLMATPKILRPLLESYYH